MSAIHDAILEVLTDEEPAPVSSLELIRRVMTKHPCSSASVRKALVSLVKNCLVYCDKTQQRNHHYSIAGDEPARYNVPASRFNVPVSLRGPILAPMAWCARQLGAV